MKILILPVLLFGLSAPSMSAPVSNANESSAPAPTTYDKLRQAQFFALGGGGFGGQTSPQELALRELARDENAEFAFLALINDETTTKVGQLYGLLGLKEKNSAQFEAQLPAFLADVSPVKLRSGCMLMTISAGGIAQYIKDRPAPQKEANA